MQLTLFKALKSINIEDDRATAVVGTMETHVSQIVNEAAREATRPLELRLVSLEAKLDAQRAQIAFTGTLLAIIGLAIAAGPIILRFVH